MTTYEDAIRKARGLLRLAGDPAAYAAEALAARDVAFGLMERHLLGYEDLIDWDAPGSPPWCEAAAHEELWALVARVESL